MSLHIRWTIAIALALGTACGDSPVREAAPVVASRDSTNAQGAEVDATPSAEGTAASRRAHLPQPELPAPRRMSALHLVPLWTAGGPDDPGRLIQPVHLFASRLGVLVSEFDGAHVRVFDSRSGVQVDTIGRFGLGPGEFGRVPFLLGTYERPLAFEGANGRLSALGVGDAPVTNRVATGRNWMSACLMAPGRVLLQSIGMRDDRYWVSTIGDRAAVVDSFPHPIASLEGVLPLARQSPLYQVDDSTCIILPVYSHEFAILRGDELVFGASIETAPTPRAEWEGEVGRSTLSLARDTRNTQRGAALWRGRLLILYGGTTEHRRRLVDIYSSRGVYDASLVLPFEARYIAAAGDTLFAVGELDDEPILGAFLLNTP